MFKTRGLLCSAVVGLVIAFGLVLFWPAPIPPGVTAANCEQIQPGMALDEIEALLGGPGLRAGTYKGGNICVERMWGGEVGDRSLPGEAYWWSGAEISLFVTFDEGNRLVYARFDDCRERNWIDHARSQLGR